ncbi:MAG: hypothetical protein IVW54_20505 [Candidatus Binataceae bacterium]|nr:hypothetical protein [Candidatus Binataceae bacterium]
MRHFCACVVSRQWQGWESGQVLLLTTITMVVLIGFAALASDVSLLWSERRHMQTAADAAAIAGAIALRNGESIASAADNAAALNHFSNGLERATVTVNNPPVRGLYAGNADYVEVIVAQPEQTYFLRLLGYDSMNVSTRAVSGAMNGRFCVYVLNPTAPNALNIDGGDSLNSNCGVMVDSNSSAALTNGGTLDAPSVGVVGGYRGGAGIHAGTLKSGIAPMGDPLAYLQPPAVGSNCDYTNYAMHGTSTATLYPGVYCGGIFMNDSSSAILNPGTYVLQGGGLTVHDFATLQGSDVTFYNTQGGHYRYRPIALQDQVTVVLSAPTSGPLAGMLFFQDRSISSPRPNLIGSKGGLTGVLYFPTTPLRFSAHQSQSVAYTIMVADTLSLDIPGVTISSDYSSLANGSPIKSTGLYE